MSTGRAQKPPCDSTVLSREMKRLRGLIETRDQEDGPCIQQPVNNLHRRSIPVPTACVAGKARLHNFILWNNPGRNSTGLHAESSGREPTRTWVRRGSRAMWIVMYIAMMASLRAMGLAPSFVPVRTDEDRPPFGEI